MKLLYTVSLLMTTLVGFCLLSTKSLHKPSPQHGVILINFDGFIPESPAWQRYDTLSPATLNAEDRSTIIDRVKEIYKDFDIVVTMDVKEFYDCPVNKRVRITVTDQEFYAYSQYGPFYIQSSVPGFSRYNALFLGDTTTGIVSATTLHCDLNKIADGVAHEAGHMVGLAHQAVWYGSTMVSEYDLGDENHVPVMGFTIGGRIPTWTIGINQFGQLQNDTLIIRQTWRRK